MIADKYTKRYRRAYLGPDRYEVIEEAAWETVTPGPLTYAEAQDDADRRNRELALERMGQ